MGSSGHRHDTNGTRTCDGDRSGVFGLAQQSSGCVATHLTTQSPADGRTEVARTSRFSTRSSATMETRVPSAFNLVHTPISERVSHRSGRMESRGLFYQVSTRVLRMFLCGWVLSAALYKKDGWLERRLPNSCFFSTTIPPSHPFPPTRNWRKHWRPMHILPGVGRRRRIGHVTV